MIRLIFTVTFRLGWWIHDRDPITKLRNHAHNQPAWYWCPITAVIAIFCLFTAATLMATAKDGGTLQWLNLVAIVFIWQGFKTMWLVPLSLWWMLTGWWRRLRATRRTRSTSGDIWEANAAS